MQDLVERIYQDTAISPAEVIELRNATDQAAEDLLAEEGREGLLDALTKSFDVTNQLVQEVSLRLKEGDYSDTGAAMVRALIESHIALLKVTLRAFD